MKECPPLKIITKTLIASLACTHLTEAKAKLPFSFVYDGKGSEALLAESAGEGAGTDREGPVHRPEEKTDPDSRVVFYRVANPPAAARSGPLRKSNFLPVERPGGMRDRRNSDSGCRSRREKRGGG